MQHLPVELIQHISAHLEHTSLTTLARTSSTLAPIAQRRLYRHLSVSAWSRNLSVVALIARKPHIARYVRSFYIALDSASPIFRRFYLVLADALRNMSDLHSLHLLVDSSASWLVRDAACPHLIHFTSTFPFDNDVARFLHKTPSLLELEVDSIPTILPRPEPVPSLPISSIPHLEQFIGSARVASLIVPGRPVSTIHLNGPSLTEDDIPLLARSTAPVLVLAAATNASPISFLQLLHRHLPRLAYLRVVSTQNLLQSPSAEFYNQVANVLEAFPELDALELFGMHWGSHRIRDDESKRVWHSSPLPSPTHPTDQLLFGTDFLLAY